MVPSINGRSFMDCSLEDLKEILDNESYRESDQVDYKKTFAVFDIPKENKEAINKEKAEFRKDVCAMANAQGGYLVYGIKEDGKGIPHELAGITVRDNNTDKFENDIRNILQTVSPKSPHCELRFKPYEDKYIIVIYVHHDFYAPYVFLENNQDYRIYKRAGNAAIIASYAELKSMFSQSLSMEKEIYNYRMERVRYFQQQEDTPEFKYSQFALLHIIPDTFLDSSYKKNLYLMQRKNQIFIGDLFQGVGCNDGPIPSVDGLRFTSYRNYAESRLFYNGIAEALIPIHGLINGFNQHPQGRLAFIPLWDMISGVIRKYVQRMRYIFDTTHIFVCISILGCKGVITEDELSADELGMIDRDVVICDPVSIEDFTDDEIVENSTKQLQIDYLLSLGIRYHDLLRKLIDDVQL